MQWLKIWLIRFSFLRILLLVSLSRNLMMSWSPCFAARPSCPSAEVSCSLRDFDFNNFILTLAQSSLTAARLPEMQSRWRGGEPKLEDIVKDTSEVQLCRLLGVKAWVDENLHQARETLVNIRYGGQKRSLQIDLICSSLATFLKILIGGRLFHTPQRLTRMVEYGPRRDRRTSLTVQTCRPSSRG